MSRSSKHSLFRGVPLPGLLLAVAALAGCAGRSALPATAPPPLAVMSFNIRYGTAPDGANAWPERRALVLRVIEDFDPDVLGVQEALKFQVDAVASAVAHAGVVGVGRDDGAAAGEYAAILYDTTRFDLLDHGTFWLSDSPELPGSMTWGNQFPRIVTWARLRDGRGETFHVLNTHWDHESQNARERGARQIVEWLATHVPPGEPVLLMGDFNAGEDNPAFRVLLDASARGVTLIDTFRALHPDASPVGTYHAFTGDRSGERIDAVLASPHWEIVDAAILDGAMNGRFPSDHFPVTATVRLRQP